MRLRRKSHAGGVRSDEGATSPVGTGAYPRCVDAQATRAWWRRPVVRARVADVLYVLIGLIVTIGQAVGAWQMAGVALVLPSVATGLLATVALLWRRRYPLRVVALAVPAVFTGQFPLLELSLAALAVRRRDRLLWVL